MQRALQSCDAVVDGHRGQVRLGRLQWMHAVLRRAAAVGNVQAALRQEDTRVGGRRGQVQLERLPGMRGVPAMTPATAALKSFFWEAARAAGARAGAVVTLYALTTGLPICVPAHHQALGEQMQLAQRGLRRLHRMCLTPRRKGHGRLLRGERGL